MIKKKASKHSSCRRHQRKTVTQIRSFLEKINESQTAKINFEKSPKPALKIGSFLSCLTFLFQIFPEDLWITRPIHIRDREVVCNDLLSVDCGIDSIFVSISHEMLKTVGEQYPINRLGMCKIGKFT